MDGHVSKNNESTFPSFVDLDDFLNKHNSNFIWLLVGKRRVPLRTSVGKSLTSEDLLLDTSRHLSQTCQLRIKTYFISLAASMV